MARISLSVFFTLGGSLLWIAQVPQTRATLLSNNVYAKEKLIVARQEGVTTVTTNITADGQPVTVEINIPESVKFFNEAVDEEKKDKAPGEEDPDIGGDVEIAATRLIRFDGCDDLEKRIIYRGWYQSFKLMNIILKEVDKINWNEASAVEYLGPPAKTLNVRDRIKDLYKRWGTIQPAYFETPFDWRLHVRCDDPRQKCKDPCDKDPRKRGPWAYATNKDPDSQVARINFCPRYFQTPSLSRAVKNGRDSGLGDEWKYDVGSYLMNQGHVWAHELMHIDWATNAERYGNNRHVSDLRMLAKRASDGTQLEFRAYGPQPAKALARFPLETGGWTMRNADSLALYATVRYLQTQLKGIYPHLPLAPAAPDTVWDPHNREEDIRQKTQNLVFPAADQRGFDLYSNNGTVDLPPLHNYDSEQESQNADCRAFMPNEAGEIPSTDDFWDEDGENIEDNVVTLDQFATAEDLGEEYVKQLNEWWDKLYKTCIVPSGCENANPAGCAIRCTATGKRRLG